MSPMSGPPLYDCALITGASSGLGEEFARQLGARCRRLVLVARREDALRQFETKLRIENPELEVASVALDLTSESERRELIDRVIGTEWAPSLLVNNAGMGDYGEFATASWEKIRNMLALNVEAATHLIHGFLPDMLRAERGGILNVSSLASLLPIPDFAVYAASKSYLTNFSEALRLEVRERGISVLALCPGPVHTGFGEAAGRHGEPPETPSREWFYVPKEEVVHDALIALQGDRARLHPGWRVALLAAAISLLPIAAIRCMMRHRPRRVES